MCSEKQYPFNIEWITNEAQSYHGPRKRMREILRKHRFSDKTALEQQDVVEFLVLSYPRYCRAIKKLKFYRIFDDKSRADLRFFLLWCDHDLETREFLFEESENIASKTGWYPVVTGNRIFHHQRGLLDWIDKGLKKAMNKSNIEQLPGLGLFQGVRNLSRGTGTSILVQTSAYDIVLDAGISDDELRLDELRPSIRKCLFVSHSHKDHTGGIWRFIQNKKFIIALSPITLELFFNAIRSHVDIENALPKNFFYRVAPMWYRSVYRFSDGSSVETVPTYHFPGSMGYIFTFSDDKSLFYSGDLNVSASYLVDKLGIPESQPFPFDLGHGFIDYGILDAALVGRKVGLESGEVGDLLSGIESSVAYGRNHLLLTPPHDYGVFLFLHLYDKLISSPTRKFDVRIFLDPNILRQLEVLEWRMKRKQAGALDDALLKFLSSRVTLAESVRVFDYTVHTERNLQELNRRKLRAVFILDDQRCADLAYMSPSTLAQIEKTGLDITRVGRAATRPAESNLIDETRITDFGESIWLLHSPEQSLKRYLLSGNQRFGDVYLFHNFKGRIEKFIKQLQTAGYSGRISSL